MWDASWQVAAQIVDDGWSAEFAIPLRVIQFRTGELDPDPRMRATLINVFRVRQSFTRDLFLRVFFQTSSVIDRGNLETVFVAGCAEACDAYSPMSRLPMRSRVVAMPRVLRKVALSRPISRFLIDRNPRGGTITPS